MRLHLRFDPGDAGVDAAAAAEFRTFLASRSSVPLVEPPRWVGPAPEDRMGALLTVLEVVVDVLQVTHLVLAIARWRRANRQPAVLVSAASGDTEFRIESTDPHAVAEIVRALRGT